MWFLAEAAVKTEPRHGGKEKGSFRNTKVTNQFTLGHFDRNLLETYEEISSEQNDIDIFANLTFRFTCKDMPSGFYADIDYNCRIFHVCENSGDGFPVICANDTVFDQKQRICTDEENIDCHHAHEWYYLNELIYSAEIEPRTITEEIPEEEESKVVQEDVVPSIWPFVID
ncbi:hypothetical protein ALC57_13475 [Trachymyrmex cornetzi]|uniref:Chitin-binding type-2 domain-containing protein n=1 Tax=Trachymyrmex cornetzi TaxID=471704 RepID=A0A195DN56_9HYME|nr:hypothetical protein ALC57_13475 [Trachymyrmex cornetzi]